MGGLFRIMVLWLSGVVLMAVVVACGGSDEGASNTTPDLLVDGAMDTSTDTQTDEDEQDTMASCSGSEVICDGACADLASDTEHCGACSTTCQRFEACEQGACTLQCPPSQFACNDVCATPSSNPLHCGSCNTTCSLSEVCSLGVCETECASSLTVCGRSCVDLDTDPAHCGACNETCQLPDAVSSCLGGQCFVALCNQGFADCDQDPANGCEADMLTDNARCGACDQACGPGEVCSAGVCQSECDTHLTRCGDSCRDIRTDRTHCGACDQTCETGEVCVGGTCNLRCLPGQTRCGDVCVRLTIDTNHCGACNLACEEGTMCVDGACTRSCEEGTTLCAGACHNLQHDNDHCGECFEMCTTSQTCTNGICTSTLCATDEFVRNNTCNPCPSGQTNDAGDDPTGPDTVCDPEDECARALGVPCATFEQAYLKA